MDWYPDASAAGVRCGIAQVAVMDIHEIEARLDKLGAMEKNRSLRFAALRVANIVGGTSCFVTCGESYSLDEMPYARRGDGTFEMPDVVSHKKQLLPAILSALQP